MKVITKVELGLQNLEVDLKSKLVYKTGRSNLNSCKFSTLKLKISNFVENSLFSSTYYRALYKVLYNTFALIFNCIVEDTFLKQSKVRFLFFSRSK